MDRALMKSRTRQLNKLRRKKNGRPAAIEQTVSIIHPPSSNPITSTKGARVTAKTTANE